MIITLAMLSLITILLVGFAGSMRFDLASSASQLNRVDAELYARMGVDAAQTELANALGSTNVSWVSQPGRLILLAGGNATAVDLCSGSSAVSASSDQAADLNPHTFANVAGNLLAPVNQPMRASWIYVNQDGTLTTNAPPAFVSANPVVGRFAYWVDDESTKINLNTAWTRAAENTALLSHPSRLELSNLFSQLSQADADAVQSVRATSPYNSLGDVSRAGGNVTNAVSQQAFSLTSYSHSPDLNMFGQPRIMLTTSANWAGGTNCLNILSSPGADPGYAANLNAASVNAAVNNLYGYLTNSAWPILPGSSFAAKYAPGNNSRIAQLAVDIVDYVRCTESTNAVVEPLRGEWAAGGFQYGPDYDTTSFVGNTRRPLITEIAVSIPSFTPLATAFNVPVTLKVEFYLPPGCGLSSLPLTQYALTLLIAPGQGTNVAGGTAVNAAQNGPTQIAVAEASPATITAGGYGVVTRTFNWGLQPNTPRPTYVSLRVSLSQLPAPAGTGTLIEVAPLQTLFPITYKLDPAGTALASITSVEVDDPAVNKRGLDWKQRASGNSFGAANSVSTLGAAPTVSSPQQDTAGGRVTALGMVFPAPKGSASNPNGIVQSVGEVGYVHTGIEVGVNSATLGVPWRTLRLQPENSGSTDLPDWALLDLFSVPSLATNVFTRPNPRSWGGKINLNARVVPFVDGTGISLFTRPNPLQGLLLNATSSVSPFATVTPALAATLASNLFTRVLASGNGLAGRSYGTGVLTNVFFTPGQAAEISGVADGGEGSEALLREIAGLAESRGNVFSIYTVGQALKQTKSGTIIVLGEQRFQNIVERWDAGAGVTFRPVFTRTLNP